MKLSIIIPSLRHDNIKRCLGYVRGSLQGFDDYEIIVISPFYVLCDQWLREDYPAGPIPAINWGFSMAKGEWVTVLCDEVILQRNCYQNMLTVMERTENRDNIGDFAVLPYYNNNVSKYLENDRAEFRARWDHLGEFKDC